MNAPDRPRRHRLRNRLVALAVGLVLAFLAAELLLRFFLFHPSDFAVERGKSLREVNFYGDRHSDEDVWKLGWLMNDAGRLRDAPGADALLGWTVTVDPGTYAHPAAATVGARTPVLLYGDSFAQGHAGPENSFEAILERSERWKEHALINYGAGGYGLDQIYLLLRETIDDWSGKTPVVLIGCFVDDDLDRCVLSFRSWPKPRFGLRGGELVEPEPVETDVEAWLRAHPLGIESYAWRFLKYRRRLLPLGVQRILRGGEQRLDEKRELSRALLVAAQRQLSERNIPHALVLFLGENGLVKAPGCEWQEEFLVETCRSIGLPFVSTRPELEAAGDRSALFLQTSSARGHYSARGNRIVFATLERAIAGQYD